MGRENGKYVFAHAKCRGEVLVRPECIHGISTYNGLSGKRTQHVRNMVFERRVANYGQITENLWRDIPTMNEIAREQKVL